MNARFRAAFTAVLAIGALAASEALSQQALAQDFVKIGFVLPMTGPQQSTGRQISAAIKLFMQQNGDTVAGRKIELIIKDDAAVPDTSKRLAQELIVNDKVQVLAGFGVTPAALAVAPIATEAKVPEIVTAAGSSIITERSPYIVRTSFTLAQSAVPMAAWAAKNGIKKVVFMGSDYSPAAEAEGAFTTEFNRQGGQLIEVAPFPAGQPGFRAVPAARPRCQAGRDLRLRPLRAGRGLRQAVSRARPGQGGHQDHRAGRRHRRRSVERHGRSGDRHRDRPFLFGRP